MLDTNKLAHVWGRLAIAVCAATLTTLYQFLYWLDAVDVPAEVKWVEYGYGVSLIIVWLIAVVVTTCTKHNHWMPCYLEAAGIPATLLGIAGISQVIT